MVGTLLDRLIEWVSDPTVFWIIYGAILFCAFLALLGTVENLILKKNLNGFVMGILFAVFVYLGIQWGRNIAPKGSAHVWRFGVAPASELMCPASSPIKAILQTSGANRCLYYFPDADFYGQTRPDRCYAKREEAVADGCERSNF